MTRGFRRRRDGYVEVAFTADELVLLRQVVGEMLGLFGEAGEGGYREGGDEASQDPLARMVGIGDAREAPDDPVLARLFPDAYEGDPEAAGEFRRYTEDSLREQKRAAAETVVAGLSARGGHLTLGEEEARTWLRALNDVRLALGTRLGVTEEAHDEFARMSLDDPRYPGFAAYDWLSFLLETLVRSLR